MNAGACCSLDSLAAQVRRFVEEELKPNVEAWIKTGYPMELHERAYQLGIQGIIFPPAYGGTPPPDFDAFYELIMVDEMSRVGGGRGARCGGGGCPLRHALLQGMCWARAP